MKYTVKFTGRKSGAIGITYPITYQINTEVKLVTLDDIELQLYNEGFEHISNLEILKDESDEVES